MNSSSCALTLPRTTVVHTTCQFLDLHMNFGTLNYLGTSGLRALSQHQILSSRVSQDLVAECSTSTITVAVVEVDSSQGLIFCCSCAGSITSVNLRASELDIPSRSFPEILVWTELKHPESHPRGSRHVPQSMRS